MRIGCKCALAHNPTVLVNDFFLPSTSTRIHYADLKSSVAVHDRVEICQWRLVMQVLAVLWGRWRKKTDHPLDSRLAYDA